ncbi:MAG: protein phosphatase 2C domain-containing protein [Deltaproteobacteria bacterium]|nr:protein phosphatase 2C domain-containing protein [Deltaproteobacteria bacterium]
MEEVEITLGQRSLPSITGEQTTASAYAGLGARHLVLLGDGAAGAVPSRLAAQVACSSALARLRASVFPELGAQIEEAFAEAHGAVRRALIGTAAEDKGGASLVLVALDAGGIVAARVGGGRVYLLRGHRLEPLFREAGPGILGQGQAWPEVVEVRDHLAAGDRVLVLSESTVRVTGADLMQLVRDPPAQLAATRLADAARRRGQHDPIAVHILEVHSDAPRPADRPHPAIARLARDRPSTIDSDGSLMGGARAARVDRLDPGAGRSRVQSGWILWFVLAVIVGAGAALIVSGGEPTGTSASAPDVASVASVVEDVAAPIEIEVEPEVVAPPEPPEIAAIFEADSKERLARNLKNHVTRNFPTRGDAVFDELEAGVMARRKDPMVVQALVELLKEPELKRTARWVQELLPRLVGAEEGAATTDAAGGP